MLIVLRLMYVFEFLELKSVIPTLSLLRIVPGDSSIDQKGHRLHPNDVCANQTSISKYASGRSIPVPKRIRDKEGGGRVGANYRTKCGVCL